ncbi:hypothetical protein K435DRAFT_70236 [Dendrothele bispora CBS 962.96]|uniref:C2H2-type domain-containing protein n=1 Tax=Dendrothele bispora (strain CBS 962.96) TaxID=1314807 RepID=A0A4S8M4Q9_DENBC|nr:hypothetical protein K435DRAFT_70236 [Dendrothele bispora CBS 962.96]
MKRRMIQRGHKLVDFLRKVRVCPSQTIGPCHRRRPPTSLLSTSTTVMAAMVATTLPPSSSGPSSQINKRCRPTPPKTFQCRGYGDCKMVFSRSEHLARHIRKHTGERPFACHCSKQFSRLDNLRQHAQTVHADKQEANERMMRELTTLHAAMAAASKAGSGRGRRASSNNSASVMSVKRESSMYEGMCCHFTHQCASLGMFC